MYKLTGEKKQKYIQNTRKITYNLNIYRFIDKTYCSSNSFHLFKKIIKFIHP